MKNKRWLCALLVLLLCVMTPCLSVLALPPTELETILRQRLTTAGASTMQEWLDGELTSQAGQGSEWIVMELVDDDTFEFSAYREAMSAYCRSSTTVAAVTKQKYALTLSMLGSDDAYIAETAEQTIGTQGVMSYIYGLMLLSEKGDPAARDVCSQLLSMQLEDGGWAVMGSVADVDVTAMALQSLSVFADDPAVNEAGKRAVSLLASRQQSDGTFASYGKASAESTAQVIMALCDWGIDPCADERFSEHDIDPLTALLSFSVEDGMFSHTFGEGADTLASTQALCALLRYHRCFSPIVLSDIVVFADTTSTTAAAVSSSAQDETDHGIDVKWIVCAGIAVAAIAVSVFLLLKKRGKKNVVIVAIAAVLLIAACLFVNIESIDEYYTPPAESDDAVGTVTLTIRCDTLVGTTDDAHIPKDGVLLPETTMTVCEGETVYDVLIRAAKTARLSIDHSGGYIRSIGQIRELDYGELSGWIYRVNAQDASVSCDQYTLSDGDVVEWHYTLALGRDIP